jgi:CTP synthase (UTP-ammonia lyase)
MAHQGIPLALALATDGANPCTWQWIHTSELRGQTDAQLGQFQGLWCAPGSPYANTAGVIAAIRYARVNGRPFLGTCGGFQHALIEYAEAVWGIRQPAHAETDPDAIDPVIVPLACSLVEQSRDVHFVAGSRLRAIYGAASAVEGYHCSYGVSSRYRPHFERGPLKVVAHDGAGDIRAVELEGHPFFVGTLFQPERLGHEGRTHPLIKAFVASLRAQSVARVDNENETLSR